LLFDRIEEKFEKSNKNPMLQYGTDNLYFNNYLILKKFFVKEFSSLGVNTGCSVALVISKSHINFMIVASLQEIESIVLMLDSKMSYYELQNNLQIYKPDVLITDCECSPPMEYGEETTMVSSLIFEIKLHIFRRNHMGSWDNISKRNNLKRALVFFTSGSTKTPKAVFRTQENIFEDAVNNIESFSISSTDKVLCAASFSHVYGFGSGSMPYLAAGATVKFISPASTFGILKKELTVNPYTVFVGLPIHYSMLAENMDNRLQIRLALVAGSALDNRLIESTHKKLGIYMNNMYGMTELGGISTLYKNISPENMYSVGQPLANVFVKMGNIMQQNADKQSLCEVYVKSKALSPGYYNFEDGDLYDIELSEGGWFNTNDLGYIGENNELYVVCRNENMINCSGEKINPSEIESVILQYVGIKEAVVIGRSDIKQGEIPVSYVVAESIIDKKEIIRFCYDRLPIHKVPRDIVQIERLPKTNTGKVLRNNLK